MDYIAESEKQLIASWISGYNQEHIKDFEYFSYYPNVLCAIKDADQISLIEIAKSANMKTSELAQIVASYMPSSYDGAYRTMKEQKIKHMVMEALRDDDIKPQLEKVLKEMDSLSAVKVVQPSDMSKDYAAELAERATAQPLNYGIPKLDYVTGGLRNKELTTIAARPSVGKTALALQIAFNLALKKNSVLFFPLEMSSSQLMERIVCRETQIQHEKLKTPSKLEKKDKEFLAATLEIFSQTAGKNLKVIEGVSSLTNIKRHIEHYKPRVVIIDQLSQLKENRRFNSFREQFTYMTNSLKAMCMEYGIPIILLAQINRGAQNTVPTLADLKESGSIEEDSDNVIMIHQDGDSIGEYTPMQIIVRKQRNGERDVFINVMYLNKKFVFREAAK